jgi:hypothetical protein
MEPRFGALGGALGFFELPKLGIADGYASNQARIRFRTFVPTAPARRDQKRNADGATTHGSKGSDSHRRRPTLQYTPRVPTLVHRDFEWDEQKAENNATKHGVTFEEAALAMIDPLSLDFEDLVEPEKLITLAASRTGRILYIVSTVRGDRIRLISARPATQSERRRYEEED